MLAGAGLHPVGAEAAEKLGGRHGHADVGAGVAGAGVVAAPLDGAEDGKLILVTPW